MAKDVFEQIKEGLEEAIAVAKSDTKPYREHFGFVNDQVARAFGVPANLLHHPK